MSAEHDDAPGSSDGPSLSSDGTLEGRLSRLEPASPGRYEPVGDPPVELAEVAPPPIEPLPVRPSQAKPRVPLYLVFGGFGVGLLLLLAALVRDVISPPPAAKADEVRALGSVESALTRRVATGHAIIQSEPSGASIVLGEQVIGITPWAGDNTIGTAPIELRLAGFKTWQGHLPDRDDPTLTVHLTR